MSFKLLRGMMSLLSVNPLIIDDLCFFIDHAVYFLFLLFILMFCADLSLNILCRGYDSGNASQKISEDHVLPLFVSFLVVLCGLILFHILNEFSGAVHAVFNFFCFAL
jgi:hypothetical protein